MQYDEKLHSKLLTCGRSLEKKSNVHGLEKPFVETILATLDYFGASKAQLGLVHFDLVQAQYKIFDWLGMAYTGRIEDPNDSSATKSVHDCIENMIKLYLAQKHVGGFAWWLRGHDLQVEKPNRCVDCIKSYDDWHNQTDEERQKEQDDLEKLYGGNVF